MNRSVQSPDVNIIYSVLIDRQLWFWNFKTLHKKRLTLKSQYIYQGNKLLLYLTAFLNWFKQVHCPFGQSSMQQHKLKLRPVRKESNVSKLRFYCPDVHTVQKELLGMPAYQSGLRILFLFLINQLCNYWNLISFLYGIFDSSGIQLFCFQYFDIYSD